MSKSVFTRNYTWAVFNHQKIFRSEFSSLGKAIVSPGHKDRSEIVNDEFIIEVHILKYGSLA